MWCPSRIALLAAGAATMGCGSDGSPTLTTFPGPAASLEEFASRVERLRGELNVPGLGVAIARGDRIVWATGLGLANVEGRAPPTGSTSFHLASLTKTYAAILLLQLEEDGRISLDDPVSRYGIVLPGAGVVRVRHLITHTSDGTPGTAYRYNGDRFDLLTRVIEQAGGASFAQRVVDTFIRPLDLRQTAPNVLDRASFARTGFDPVLFEQNLARGYSVGPSGQFVATAYPSHFGAAAGLMSSAADVAQYSMAIDANAFLREETKRRMFSPATLDAGAPIPYGLGWFVQTVSGVKVVWHYGSWTANSSLIIKVPERELTFVILANGDRLSTPFDLAAGNVMVSPIAREFVNAFVTGTAPLP
jgi:CubicO group peptidase (beta-lactamase class C family)